MLLLLGISHIISQGIAFEPLTLDEALNKSASENKPVFVDVYTDWCAPCKRMDITTFKDSLVGANFNSDFISFKADAEDKASGTLIANRYGITSYPTLLFLTSSGEVLLKAVGLKTKYELIGFAEESKILNDNYSFITEVKNNSDATYSKSDLENILGMLVNHSFDGKERLVMQYLDHIDQISEDDLRLVMGEVDKIDLDYLKRIVPLTTSLSYQEMSLRRNSKSWLKWNNDTELTIYQRIKDATNDANLTQLEATMETLKLSGNIQNKQIDNLYYDYYRRNDLDQYRDFASYLITEYIIPSRPEDVAAADREKYKMLNEQMMKDFKAIQKSSDYEIVLEEDITTETPRIDSLAEIYTISKSIADQLFEISGDFFAFFEDESSHRKAEFWASLSHVYYPYDYKYYDNHIYILESRGKHLEANEVRNKAKNQPWYNEMMIKTRSGGF